MDLIKRPDAIKELAEYLMMDAQNEWAGTASEDIEDWKELAETVFDDIPSAEPWDIYNFDEWCTDCKEYDTENHRCPRWNKVIRRTLEENKPKQGEWIPCSERLPEDLEIVNITWVNHRPMNYYADIKDKPFVATAIHHRDRWWWYSPICEDMLAEYGKSECDKMDADIEVIAWMPLPEPWEGADNEGVR